MGGSVTAGDLIPKKCKYYYAPTLIQSWLALLYPAAPSSRQRGLASGKARRRRGGSTGLPAMRGTQGIDFPSELLSSFSPSSLYLVFIQSHLSPSLLFLSLLSGPSRAKRLWCPLCDLPRLKRAPAKAQPAGLAGVTVDMDEAQHPFEEMPPR